VRFGVDKGDVCQVAKPSVWLWADENGGTQGVTVDYPHGKLLWYDNPGCACGDSTHEQTIADFLQKGARYAEPPDDIVAEMRAALAEESQPS
jgi:hypothetical protein